MIGEDPQNDRRAVAVIDDKCKVLCANSAFNAHFGLHSETNNPVSIDDLLPINVKFAYQDFLTNSDVMSTRVVSDLLSDGFMKKQLSTLSFSKLNVENSVFSLIILNQEISEPAPAINLVS
ncbi:transcriptional regulator [Candidatus Symbiopectobacterium sp. 'North America']|uniref:transcriptional regulator n=1 Tax=Candidatus Symbiopectobacterium sp. 'North America' TaxID=2794574 RepID=UPI0018C9DB9B|nr:transcriptional regulator [Candidatus Symbiopectobacterium sp. 'North America']MBG6244726.1 transcriptional regulator [Candidatus Symbiopectobacterium sp. 'North America']